MQTNFAAVNLVAAPEPPAPARPHEEEARTRTERRDGRDDDAFDRALKQEIERKESERRALAALPPAVSPFPAFVPTPVVTTGESDAVSAASGLGGLASAYAATTALNTVSASTASSAATQAAVEAPARVEREAADAPQAVGVVVEAGLPPVQPAPGDEGHKVSLVDFPQLVMGTVRMAVKDNKPLTQLDFQITPPHVGPVNLSVSYMQGVVGVQLTALTLQAKQALEGQVSTIQQILTAHNLTPGQIKVVTAVGGKAGASGAGARGDSPTGFGFFAGGRRRQPGAEDGTVKTT